MIFLQYVNLIYVEVNICMCKIHTHKLRTVIISAKFKTFLTFLFV